MSSSTPVQGTQTQETAAGSSQRADMLGYSDEHNIRACLDKSNATKACDEMIDFLTRSRIQKAISEAVICYASHQREFWSTAVLDNDTDSISATIQGRLILLNADMLNEVLNLGDAPEDPMSINSQRVKGCLLRCGYPKEKIKVETVWKSDFSIPYKYLVHVISHCMSTRRAGHDQLALPFSQMFVSLVMNVRYSISKVIFKGIKENLRKKKDKFLMYPRFLQMVFNNQVPDLTKLDDDKMKLKKMNDATFYQMNRYFKRIAPPPRRLICFLSNPEYKAPSKAYLWRNENSTSATEPLKIVEEDEEEEVQSIAEIPMDENIEELDANVDLETFLDDVEEGGESLVDKRKRAGKEKVGEEQEKKKRRKSYRVQLIEEPVTKVKPTQAATQETAPAQASTGLSSQIPKISMEENVQTLTTQVLKLIATNAERDKQLKVVGKLLDESLKREHTREKEMVKLLEQNAERDQRLEKLELENAEQKKEIVVLKEENKYLQQMTLKHEGKIGEHDEKIGELEGEIRLRIKDQAETEEPMAGGTDDEEEG